MPVEALKPSLPRLMVEDAVRAALGPVGQACGACHKAYRQSDN